MARICTVLFNDYYSDARVRREIEAFVSRGDEVDCICLPKPGGESVRTLFGARLYFHFLGKFQGRNRVWYLFRHLLFMLDVFFKLCRLQIKRRYDVILIHTLPDYLVFAAAFPKIFGAKIVLDVHELMPEIYSSKYGTVNRLVIKFLTWVEKLSIAFADKAIAVHDPHLEALIKHGNPPEKFGVLLNVPDPKLFQRRLRLRRSVRPTFKLIYHGTVAKRNGVDIALRAFALAKSKIPDLQFCVIGR